MIFTSVIWYSLMTPPPSALHLAKLLKMGKCIHADNTPTGMCGELAEPSSMFCKVHVAVHNRKITNVVQAHQDPQELQPDPQPKPKPVKMKVLQVNSTEDVM